MKKASSSQEGKDSAFVLQVVEAIQRLSEGKTVITIAHRLSTILSCDKVAVMDAGKILDVDTHENLRKNSEIYRLLFENQYQQIVQTTT